MSIPNVEINAFFSSKPGDRFLVALSIYAFITAVLKDGMPKSGVGRSESINIVETCDVALQA